MLLDSQPSPTIARPAPLKYVGAILPTAHVPCGLRFSDAYTLPLYNARSSAVRVGS